MKAIWICEQWQDIILLGLHVATIVWALRCEHVGVWMHKCETRLNVGEAMGILEQDHVLAE
jgi:hypothetical protein